MARKVAVFLGDFFWSSIPYDGLELQKFLNQQYDCDLILFQDDVRITGKFSGRHRFTVDQQRFLTSDNLRLIKSWDELKRISAEYFFIITSVHIAPKTRYPYLKDMKCPIAVWDIGGADILSNSFQFATFFFVKGKKWKEWVPLFGVPDKNVFVTGTPHYDQYFQGNVDRVSLRDKFFQKYKLQPGKDLILVLPSNPGGHRLHHAESHKFLVELSKVDANVVVKTHPLDYLFYEKEKIYSGIYRRQVYRRPQYEEIESQLGIKAIDSDDHFSAMFAADKVVNLTGSHVAWETCFVDALSFAVNLKDKPYYRTLKHLPSQVIYPDELINYHVNSIDELFSNVNFVADDCLEYFERQVSVSKISDAVKSIIDMMT